MSTPQITPITLSEADWSEWRCHPCTIQLQTDLLSHLESLKANWAAGAYSTEGAVSASYRAQSLQSVIDFLALPETE